MRDIRAEALAYLESHQVMTLATGAGDDPQPDLGLAVGGRLGGDAQIAGPRELGAAPPRHRQLHEMVFRQVHRHPVAGAVVAAQQEHEYRRTDDGRDDPDGQLAVEGSSSAAQIKSTAGWPVS